MSDIVDELKTGRGLTEGVMRDAWVHAKMQEAADLITALRAENERLRAALGNAAEQMEWLTKNDPYCMGWVGPPWPPTTPAIKVAAEKARAALAAPSGALEGKP